MQYTIDFMKIHPIHVLMKSTYIGFVCGKSPIIKSDNSIVPTSARKIMLNHFGKSSIMHLSYLSISAMCRIISLHLYSLT